MNRDGFVFGNRALYAPAADALVVADLHLGKDRTSDVELPLGERPDILNRMAGLLDTFEPATVVVAGDLLHSFESIPDGVADSVSALADLVRSNDATLRVLEGNHDTMLSALLEEPVGAEYRLGPSTIVLHGDEMPEESVGTYVVGHEHPAIRIEGDRHPCVLDCPNQYDGSRVIVLPAYTRLAKGTVVNAMSAGDSIISLVTNVHECRPIVWTETEPLEFPPLKSMRSFL